MFHVWLSIYIPAHCNFVKKDKTKSFLTKRNKLKKTLKSRRCINGNTTAIVETKKKQKQIQNLNYFEILATHKIKENEKSHEASHIGIVTDIIGPGKCDIPIN